MTRMCSALNGSLVLIAAPCLDRGDGIARDFGIRPFGAAGQPNLEIVCQSKHAGDALRRGFGFGFFRVAFDEADEGHDAIFYGHPDIGASISGSKRCSSSTSRLMSLSDFIVLLGRFWTSAVRLQP